MESGVPDAQLIEVVSQRCADRKLMRPNAAVCEEDIADFGLKFGGEPNFAAQSTTSHPNRHHLHVF